MPLDWQWNFFALLGRVAEEWELSNIRTVQNQYKDIFDEIIKYKNTREYQFFDDYSIIDDSKWTIIFPIMSPSGIVIFAHAEFEMKLKDDNTSRYFSVKNISFKNKAYSPVAIPVELNIWNYISGLLMNRLWSRDEQAKILA